VSAHLAPGWVNVADRLPAPYYETPVILVDGARRVGRLNSVGCWQLAGFKADAHKYQYQGDVKAWFDEDHPSFARAADQPPTDAQHARVSVELRSLCVERDQLRFEVRGLMRLMDSKRALFQAGRDSYKTHTQPMNTDDEAWDEYLRGNGITKEGGA